MMSINEERLREWIEQVTKKLEHLEASQIAIINGDFQSEGKPKEPRINDDDARNAVYSWASSLQVHEVRCWKRANGFGIEVTTFVAFRLSSEPKIEFTSSCLDADVTDGIVYTIAELCGEEEE